MSAVAKGAENLALPSALSSAPAGPAEMARRAALLQVRPHPAPERPDLQHRTPATFERG